MSNPSYDELRADAVWEIIKEWREEYGCDPTQDEIELELEAMIERYG